MQSYTSIFGNFNVDEEGIINFAKGIPGFNELHRFVILPHENNSPVHFLQCLDDTQISFAITNPKHFFPEYELEVDQSELVELGLHDVAEAVVSVILVVSSDPKNITANLLAPVLINPITKMGKQIVMSGDRYTTCHRLFAK